MLDNSANNKRIAKNTIILYIRLVFVLAVGLFTSRVILKTLGIEDYGINNVVAGVVSMFSIFTGSLSTAISRFMTFGLGKGDSNKQSLIFSTSVNIVVVMAIIMIALMEMAGVWFLNSNLNIPIERMYAANWVFQFSIITFVISLIIVPFNASIIAHEKASVFAYISIIDVSLKLIIVYLLYISPYDKLISYSALLSTVTLVVLLVYIIYCTRHFTECRYKFQHDKSLLGEMSEFAGWNFFGNSAFMLYTQGVNIASNMFFGVTINAARGIASQIDGVVRNFINNFATAINPQITKSYASDNYDYTYNLVCKGAKYSFFVMLLLSIPFFFESEAILRLWLGEYPAYAPLFLRLTLIGTMIDLLGNSLTIAVFATGKIKKYYLIIGPISLLVLPISCVLFSLGFPAYVSYIVIIVIYSIIQIIRLFIARDIMNFPIKMYCHEVFVKIIPVTVFSLITPAVLYNTITASNIRSIVIVATSLISVLVCSFIIGLGKNEKNIVTQKLRQFIHKI